MSAPATATATGSARGALASVAAGAWRAIVFVWKWIFGAALCTFFPGALVVVGWTQRLSQRAIRRRWWRTSEVSERASFEEHWPNWIVAQRPTWTVRGVPRTLFHSLAVNLKLGVQCALATWVVTAPAWSLWIFSWYAGWNNSFHKGYEQAWVGPTTGIVGSVLFAVAMLYVPLAQARHASTGNWRAFFQLRVVRAVARERWLACLGLALLYLLVALPVMAYRAWPTFGGTMADFDALSDAQLREWLQGYWFRGCLFVFPLFAGLRLVSARIYASALPRLVERGAVREEDLEGSELADLRALRPGPSRERERRLWIVRVLAWSGTFTGRATTTVLSVLAWLVFVFLLYASQFLNYQPVLGWLVHPLVQAPWYGYVPSHLGG